MTQSSSAATAYVGLGANLGDRLGTLRGALERLHDADDPHITRLSSVYETRALPRADSKAGAAAHGPAIHDPPFLNAVIALRTRHRPVELLARLLEIEAAFGRRRAARWAPRTLDLDLLLYAEAPSGGTAPGGAGITSVESLAAGGSGTDLALPHPRVHERDFVLVPLIELGCPIRFWGRSASEWLACIPPASRTLGGRFADPTGLHPVLGSRPISGG